MPSKIISSPLLHVAEFVGTDAKGNPLAHAFNGDPWLWCADFGFSFCVREIDESFKPLAHGDIVRLYVSLFPFPGCRTYPMDKACAISALGDRMIEQLFGCEIGTEEWEDALLDHLGLSPEDCPDMPDVIPGDVYYCVRRV